AHGLKLLPQKAGPFRRMPQQPALPPENTSRSNSNNSNNNSNSNNNNSSNSSYSNSNSSNNNTTLGCCNVAGAAANPKDLIADLKNQFNLQRQQSSQASRTGSGH
ncbi:unnamed protein product, partial [Polarella glacialis]